VLPDIVNFRDAGGHPSGEFAPGVVFRSSELDRAAPEPLSELQALKVRQVFDLRTAQEVADAGDHLPAGISLQPLDVMADGPANGASAIAAVFAHHVNRVTVDDLNRGLGAGRAFDLMTTAYSEFVTFDSAHTGFRDLLIGISDSTGSSVVHCTAGKDRTGWGVALLQHIAGVHDDDIVQDFLSSNDAWAPTYEIILDEFADLGGDRDALRDILWVHADYLGAAIHAIDREFGSRSSYLRTGLGLSDDDLGRLRHRLASAA